MFHSLRSRLIILSLVVALIAVACVGFLFKNFTQIEFQDFLANSKESDLKQFQNILSESYRQNNGWSEVQKALENITRTTGDQLILVDTQSKIIAASPPELLLSDIKIDPQHNIELEREEHRGNEVTANKLAFNNVPHITLSDSQNIEVGTLYTAPILLSTRIQNESSFESSLNRTMLSAALISAFLAMLAAVILSKRILGPIEKLTKAASLMENGNYSQQVEVTSKDEIGGLSRAFNLMSESLARAEQLRRNMINDIAHELRTPLTNIRCHIETIQDGLSLPTPEFIDSLHEEALLLNHLVDDLQNLALAESGRLNIELKRVSVNAIINAAINTLQYQNTAGSSVIKTEIQENCPDVTVDSKRIVQALRNLINNSIIHTPLDGLIKIRAYRVNANIEFAVEDTGSGIPEKDLPFVFERFYRSDSSRAHATGGTGLGLAIVKQIISSHGGEIRVESEIDHGTKIYFTLPISKEL